MDRPLRVDLVRAGDPAWDAWLSDVPRDIYHTAGYHLYAGGSGDGDPYLVVVGDRQRGLAWPYLLRRISDGRGQAGTDAVDVSSVYGYPGPLAWGCMSGDPFVARAWSEVTRTWREQGAVSAFTRFHPLLDNASLVSGLPWPSELAARSGPVVAIGPTVSIDCGMTDEAALASYARALRQHIAAGRRAGLVTLHDEDWTHLPTFTRLYRETMARSGAGDFYFFDQSDFERLRIALAGHVHLLVTHLGDQVGAAGLFTELDGIVQAHLVGTEYGLRDLSPFKVLLEDARAWARARGDAVLHIGGGRGGREDSLFRFKGEFSHRRHLFQVGGWILHPGSYRDLLDARRASLADEDLLDETFFPAYRAPAVAPGSTPGRQVAQDRQADR